MTTVINEWGRMDMAGKRVLVRLERRFEHPVERVWTMLTSEAMLPLWLAPGTIEPRVGGRARIAFDNSGCPIDSPVTCYDRPHRLCYSWSQDGDTPRPVSWQLQEDGIDTHLTLALELPLDDWFATACAGWDAHLEMLGAALEGVAIHFPKGRFQQARQGFNQLRAG